MPPLFSIIFDESLAIVIPMPHIKYQAEDLSSKPPGTLSLLGLSEFAFHHVFLAAIFAFRLRAWFLSIGLLRVKLLAQSVARLLHFFRKAFDLIDVLVVHRLPELLYILFDLLTIIGRNLVSKLVESLFDLVSH